MDVDADDSIARKRPHAAEETKIAGDSGIVDLPPAKRIKLVEVYDEHEGEFVQNGNATPKRWEKSLVELYEESSDSDDDEPPDRIAATRSGFDPDIMSPIELEYFPEYREYSQDYLKTRNFILMIWKRNSHRFLTWRRIARDMAVRLHTEGVRVYHFLMLIGKINVGVFEGTSSKVKHFAGFGLQNKRIIVVGAGASGLIAARQLSQFGFEVVVLEARKRLGGRVNTLSSFGNVDSGASIITGLIGNPLDDPFQQLKLRAVKIHDPAFFYDRGTGSIVSRRLESRMEKLFDEGLEKTTMLQDIVKRRMKVSASQSAPHHQQTSPLNSSTPLGSVNPTASTPAASPAQINTRHQGDDERSRSPNRSSNRTHNASSNRTSTSSNSTNTPLNHTHTSPNHTNVSSVPTTPTSSTPTSRPRRDSRTPLRHTTTTADAEGDATEAGRDDANEPTDPALTEELIQSVMQDASLGKVLDQLIALPTKPDAQAMLDWSYANLEYACAANLDRLSLLHWDQDNEYDFDGTHLMLSDGYQSMIAPIADGLDIRFDQVVNAIQINPNLTPNTEQTSPQSTSSSTATINNSSTTTAAATTTLSTTVTAKTATTSMTATSSSSTEPAENTHRKTFNNHGNNNIAAVSQENSNSSSHSNGIGNPKSTSIRGPLEDSTPSPPKKVTVRTEDGNTYSGDAVLVTLPLGVLKADWVQFMPPLPEEKRSAISRLGFGLLNKIILRFDYIFWNDDSDWIGVINSAAKQRSTRGYAYMFWNMHRFSGEPVLVALCSGDSAHLIEQVTTKELVEDACKILQEIYHLSTPPVPVLSHATRWSKDRFARGSYSYIALGSTGADYDELAKPIDNTIFFAGEATNRFHPATVAGAYESGVREAFRIFDAFIPRETPTQVTYRLDPIASKQSNSDKYGANANSTTSSTGTKRSKRQNTREQQHRGFVRLGGKKQQTNDDSTTSTPQKTPKISIDLTQDEDEESPPFRRSLRSRQSRTSEAPNLMIPDSPKLLMISKPSASVSRLHHWILQSIILELVPYFGQGNFLMREQIKALSKLAMCDILENDDLEHNNPRTLQLIRQVVHSLVQRFFPSAIDSDKQIDFNTRRRI